MHHSSTSTGTCDLAFGSHDTNEGPKNSRSKIGTDKLDAFTLLQDIRKSQAILEKQQAEIQQTLNQMIERSPSWGLRQAGSWQETCRQMTKDYELDFGDGPTPKDKPSRVSPRTSQQKHSQGDLAVVREDKDNHDISVTDAKGSESTIIMGQATTTSVVAFTTTDMQGSETLGGEIQKTDTTKSDRSQKLLSQKPPPTPTEKSKYGARHSSVSCRHARGELSKLQGFVVSSRFTHTFSLAILCNAIVIGAEVDYRTEHIDANTFYTTMQYFFFLVFTAELSIRLVAFKTSFFFGRDASWNLFDLSMVGLSMMELVDSHLTSRIKAETARKVFRVVRMFRVVRIFRVFRFSPQLRIMMFMILESVKSLGWLVCLLSSFLYVFSIIFTSGSIEYLGVPGSADYKPGRKYAKDFEKNYGSVARSLYSCFRSMTGGQSWGELMDPFLDMDMGWIYASFFIAFILFAILCFLNVVTGVFVDGALEKSKQDREMAIEKELNQKKVYIDNLKQIFDDTDDDESGTISQEEFENYLKDDRVQAYFASLRIDASDIGSLFKMLDRDGSGEIEFTEFIDNLLHLMRAQSPEQTVQKLLNENRRTAYNLAQFMEYVGSMVDSMEATTKGLPHMQRQFLDEIEMSIRTDHQFPLLSPQAPLRPASPIIASPAN